MPVYPHANVVSAQALIYLFSCLSVPVISFLAACDQFPHHAMMVSKVKLAALRIILHLMPHLKKQWGPPDAFLLVWNWKEILGQRNGLLANAKCWAWTYWWCPGSLLQSSPGLHRAAEACGGSLGPLGQARTADGPAHRLSPWDSSLRWLHPGLRTLAVALEQPQEIPARFTVMRVMLSSSWIPARQHVREAPRPTPLSSPRACQEPPAPLRCSELCTHGSYFHRLWLMVFEREMFERFRSKIPSQTHRCSVQNSSRWHSQGVKAHKKHLCMRSEHQNVFHRYSKIYKWGPQVLCDHITVIKKVITLG